MPGSKFLIGLGVKSPSRGKRNELQDYLRQLPEASNCVVGEGGAWLMSQSVVM